MSVQQQPAAGSVTQCAECRKEAGPSVIPVSVLLYGSDRSRMEVKHSAFSQCQNNNNDDGLDCLSK